MTEQSDSQPAKPLGFNLRSIEKFAEAISDKLRYSEIRNIRQVVEDIGGRIEIKNFYPKDLSNVGELRINGDSGSDLKIYLPLHTTHRHDTFTIAHELGHYFLHFLVPNSTTSDQKKFIAESVGGIDKAGMGQEEIEANWFALAFLMPAQEFSKSFKKLDGDFAALAKLFDVPVKAVKLRNKMIGGHKGGEGSDDR